ncbi:MAG TPA: DNA-processing protein DprA [Bacteroidia bacterium]|nr:DNA-processing protein DprA [Bacteroidia bacterium]
MKSKEYNWFKLFNTTGFGAKSIHYIFRNLQSHGLAIHDLFELDTAQLQNYFPEIGRGKFSRASLPSLQHPDEEKIYNDYQKLKEEKVHIITLDDERYPENVLENMQDNAPPILFCKGYLPLLNSKGISIVGSRDVDAFGVMLTKSIASKLAEHGYNVTSGYAKGVDTSAHLGALEAGGTTTIILSFGVTHISIKKEMKELDWERNSLFISQFAPNEKFSGSNAMIRNKLVCAMSQAIVVIASGPERDKEGRMSGTYDAGKSALKMGIPVFVLSPQVLKPPPQGNIDLIKLGGVEFSDGNDIVNYLTEHKSEPALVQEKAEPYGIPEKNPKSKKTKTSTDGQTSFNF